jgi:myosin-crossreactive antigen
MWIRWSLHLSLGFYRILRGLLCLLFFFNSLLSRAVRAAEEKQTKQRDMAEKVHRVAVVGGGISGLAACRFVQKRLQDSCSSKRIILIEQGQRLGGWLHSLRTPEGFVFEAGPSR